MDREVHTPYQCEDRCELGRRSGNPGTVPLRFQRRHEGEALLIGDNIEVEILAMTHDYLELGVRAPRQFEVVRKELRLTHELNREAAQFSSLDVSSHLAKFCGNRKLRMQITRRRTDKQVEARVRLLKLG